MIMATADSNPGVPTPSAPPGNGLLILLAAMTPEQLESVFANLAASFPREDLLIASPDAIPDAVSGALAADSHPSLRIVPAPASNSTWTLTATDFVSAYQLAEKHEARAILMLDSESGSLGSSALREIANAVF